MPVSAEGLLRALWRHRTSSASAWVVLAVLCMLAAAAPWIAPHAPAASVAPNTFLPLGTPGFRLGSDIFGRDELSRLLWGGRPLIFSSVVSVAGAMLFGAPIGLICGYSRGLLGALLAGGIDALLSFPLVLLAILLVAALGPGVRNMTIAIGISQAPVFARLVMALCRREAAKEYVLAARACGMGTARILFSEIAPNLMGPLIVQCTSSIALAAVYSAALSYLGLGVQPPEADWGYMVKEAQEYLLTSPWLAILPGGLITIFVAACNFAGDGLHAGMEAQ